MSDPVFRSGPAAGVPYLLKRGAGALKPNLSVIMLHGWGGDEQVMWVLENVLPETKLVASLRGLYPIPGSGYQWADAPASSHGLMEDYRAGGRAILSVLDELVADESLDRDALILMGFSQGAGIAFSLAGLGKVAPLAIICLAGFLPQGDLSLFAGLPVFWGHGALDELVPVETARTDVERLHKAGADVTYCEADVGHRLGIECTRGLKGWLETLLKGEAGS
jgi:phospholipase/carboxylesterase